MPRSAPLAIDLAYREPAPTYWLDTASGRRVDLADPNPEDMCLGDVARALSQICRFGGHCREYFSVAQHALLVEQIVAESGSPRTRLAALHHDSHEAFICDIPSPLKKLLKAGSDYGTFRSVREKLDAAISSALGVPTDLSDKEVRAIAEADTLAFEVEARQLLYDGGRMAISDRGRPRLTLAISLPQPLPPTEAARAFEQAHRRLTDGLD
jgi:uncharacterized protein